MIPSFKQIATQFLQLTASGKIPEAYDQFVALNFIHHNTYFKGDRASLMQAMQENAHTHPNKKLEIKKIVEEDDLVITYSHVIFNITEPGVAVVHIFRFENGKIVELWDLGQAVPKSSLNENGMF